MSHQRDTLTTLQLQKSLQSISSLFSKQSGEDDKVMAVTKAETIMSWMLAEINIPMNTADTFTRAVKVMFPDSEIARNFQCDRSKSTALVKELSRSTREDLLASMQ